MRLGRDGDSHAARGAVAHVAHRVDWLARTAGRDQDLEPVERARGEAGAADRLFDRRQDLGWLGEASDPELAPGSELARARRDDAGAARRERVEVGLRCGVLVHLVVHRGRDHQRRWAGECCAREQVVGYAVGELGDGVGRRRHDRVDVSPAHQLEVRNGRVIGRRVARKRPACRIGLELVDQDRSAGDALKGRLADELKAGGRLHDTHRMARLDGEPNELNRLVGGDASRYPNKNPRHDLRMTRKRTKGCNQPVAPLTSDL